ncbi:bolA-like protein 3 [Copidosoma floridanum]|uniref:bolA-like protein 3 n=1 Tax=Copidosoma floridanum TaxID=29053 RepID=UPI0006C947AE|nr:bolA-like protein 3 [Copidosoma floridanum]
MFQRLWASNSRSISLISRVWNGQHNVLSGKKAEDKMTSLLKDKFPKAKVIEVCDVSGGCGAMFEVSVITSEFKGLNTIKQHRLINEILKEEIKDMHGIRIHTSVAES